MYRFLEISKQFFLEKNRQHASSGLILTDHETKSGGWNYNESMNKIFTYLMIQNIGL